MTTPSLVIGLGGSGLKTATYIKKNFYETNKNQLPLGLAIQVLDTEQDVKFQAGGWGQERTEEHSTGPIKIDIGEYIALTGNVKAVGEEVLKEQKQIRANPSLQRNMPYRHISSWFQAQYYLTTSNVRDQIWNLDEGAGRYRQFGRLGFFTNIADVTRKLKDAMQAVQRTTQGRTLHVHIVGSLAGGTGAAMFTDVAHLVKQIAKDIGYQQEPNVLGHFILSEAFRGTPEVKLNEPGVLRNFNARMYAALRELTRLQGPVIARVGGYPLVYDPHGTGEMNSSLEGSPYAAVYLYDGIAERVQLNRFEVEKGLAPAIADVITAYIDERSGGAFRSHSVNTPSFYEAYNIPTGAVTYGTVGTYTVELPIYHITEGWSHQLAKDVLDTLLAPDPQSLDKDTGVPSHLVANAPGSRKLEPKAAMESWVRDTTSSLISRLVEWGQQAGRTDVIKQQTADAILALTAEGWFHDLAPSDPVFQDYVADARAELEGSLADRKNPKYYVDTKQPGGSNEQKAGNLQTAVDDNLRLMLGDNVDIWQRTGGDFRRSLVRLGNHHVLQFERSLIKAVKDYLNGADVGTASEQKGGKLGFVIAFLADLEQALAVSAQTLTMAESQSRGKRRPTFDAIESERKQLFTDLQKSSGVMGRTATNYRNKSDQLAQFHKADIARQVVHDLAATLHLSAAQLLAEARLWERALATATADSGGAYGLLTRGQAEITQDRQQSETAVRWVIKDNEEGDTYIKDKYTRFAGGKRDEILSQIEWRVDKVDGTGDMRIDFAFAGEQPWSRQAGQRGQKPAGQRNLARLLSRCRTPFADAWTDMSVTAYLYQNFYENGPRIQPLAERIHRNSGYLLQMVPTRTQGPTMRTAFMRVFQENLDDRGTTFLRDLRSAVAQQFGETTTASQRANAARQGEGGEDGQTGGDYLSGIGQPSVDRFKLSFLIYGDLLMPEDIAAFADGQKSYHQFSGAGSQWQELQVLPADTYALEIERELEKAGQRRREFDAEVVTVMEQMGNFQIAMRCLAYGETDYDWGIGGKTGLLLNRYTPYENNPSGYSYWRLVLLPEGTMTAGGRVVDAYGQAAEPLEYQLSDQELAPSLLDAFIQLVSLQKDKITGSPINWNRVEATVKQAMVQHSDIWRSRGETGWQLLDGRPSRLMTELTDKAAQTIRLNALVASIDEELQKNRWAWSQDDQNPPATIAGDRERVAAIRKGVDLYTAIRGAAQQDLLITRERLLQIGVQTSVAQTEKIELGAAYGHQRTADAMTAPGSAAPVMTAQPVPETTPTPADGVGASQPVTPTTVGGWDCPNGHHNTDDTEYCTECGQRKPVVVPEAVDEPVTPEPGSVPKTVPLQCENGHNMEPGWAFCAACGAPPAKPKAQFVCVNGHELEPGWGFCPTCGGLPAAAAEAS